ncbi:MAG: NHL repeat-containing protein, partial [Bryocella sp.]
VMEFSKSGAVLSGAAGYKAGGIRYPSAVAADASGNVWVVNNGNSSVTKLSSSGVPSQSTGYAANGALQFGLTVAIDSKSTPWIATAGGTAVHLAANGSLIRSATCCAIPNGIAIDGNDDPWVADQYGSAIVHVSATTGAIVSTTTSGGVKNPNGIAVDSAGNVWATNGFTGTITEVNASGVALSPSTGLGVDVELKQPIGLAIDASGSLWVVSNADNRLVRFVGLASPVKTPLVSGPTLP